MVVAGRMAYAGETVPHQAHGDGGATRSGAGCESVRWLLGWPGGRGYGGIFLEGGDEL